jgi:hypothetical protein
VMRKCLLLYAKGGLYLKILDITRVVTHSG